MDGGQDFQNHIDLSGEPRIPGIFVGEPKDELSPLENMKLNVERDEYIGLFYERWNESAKLTKCGRPVDVLLSPVLPFVGSPLNGYTHVSYTAHWNYVGFPAITIPVRRVEQHNRDVDEPLDYIAGRPLKSGEAEALAFWKEMGGVAGFDGLPIVIQLIGRRFEEENLLGVAKAVCSVLCTGVID